MFCFYCFAVNDANRLSNEKNDEFSADLGVADPPEANLDPAVLHIFGADPNSAVAIDNAIDPQVLSRWKHFREKRWPDEEREKILSLYPRQINDLSFEAPTLNPEFTGILIDTAKRRDAYLKKTQNTIGAALVALGSAISLMIKPSSEDDLEVLARQWDCAKLLMDAFEDKTRTRRKLIIPCVDKKWKSVLEATAPGKFLFGDELVEKLKLAKSVEKAGNDMLPAKIPSDLNSKGQTRRYQGPGRSQARQTGQGNQTSEPKKRYGQYNNAGKNSQHKTPKQNNSAAQAPPK